MLKERNLPSSILYLTKLVFRIGGTVSQTIKKVKEFINTKSNATNVKRSF